MSEPSEAAVDFIDRAVATGLDYPGMTIPRRALALETLAREYDAAIKYAADLAAGAALADYTAMKEACEKAEAEVERLKKQGMLRSK